MKYRHHKYTWSKPFTSVRHRWELVGPIGAIDFHVSFSNSYGPSCGLEYHHTEACGFRTDEAPDHVNCPLTGGRCWHDGTSLYASEHLWPYIEPYLKSGDHERIFKNLESEAERYFAQFKQEKSA